MLLQNGRTTVCDSRTTEAQHPEPQYASPQSPE